MKHQQVIVDSSDDELPLETLKKNLIVIDDVESDESDLPEIILHVKTQKELTPIKIPELFNSCVDSEPQIIKRSCTSNSDLENMPHTPEESRKKRKVGFEFSLQSLASHKKSHKDLEEFRANLSQALQNENVDYGKNNEDDEANDLEYVDMTIRTLKFGKDLQHGGTSLFVKHRVLSTLELIKTSKKSILPFIPDILHSSDVPILFESSFETNFDNHASFTTRIQEYLHSFLLSQRISIQRYRDQDLFQVLQQAILIGIDSRYEDHGALHPLMSTIFSKSTFAQLENYASAIFTKYSKKDHERLKLLQILPISNFRHLLAWSFFCDKASLGIREKPWKDMTAEDHVNLFKSLPEFHPTENTVYSDLRFQLLYYFYALSIENKSSEWSKLGRASREMLLKIRDESGMDFEKTRVKEILITFEIVCHNGKANRNSSF